MKNQSLATRLDFYAKVYDLRQSYAKKRAPFWANAVRLDDCLETEDGSITENALLSDNGICAQKIRTMGEMEPWQVEFGRVMATLTPTERRVVEALDQDTRPTAVARITGINRRQVYRVLNSLRKLLKNCHTLRNFCE
ncbi:MAG: hypothetical protein ACI4RA_07565 [Kiritimatiellia bacterium]